jgi:hypothetical protein
MPGYDGTGPRGRGPMTGESSGFCLLKLPCDPGGGIAGFAGLAGKPVPGRTYDRIRPDRAQAPATTEKDGCRRADCCVKTGCRGRR